MKKLVVLMALLVVSGMLWAQAAAAPAMPALTTGLTLDYMWANDFGKGKEFTDKPILELKFTWTADENNTAYIELEEGPITGAGSSTGAFSTAGGNGLNAPNLGGSMAIAGLDRAYFTSNIGKALKLPVPVTVMYGLQEWNNKDGIKVTKSEWEDFLGEKDIRRWGAQIEVTPAPVVTLRSQWAWNFKDSQFLIGAYGTQGPVSYEVTYYTNGEYLAAVDNTAPVPDFPAETDEVDDVLKKMKGWIEGGVKFAQDVNKDINISAAAMFEYDMASYQDLWLDAYKANTTGGTSYSEDGIEYSAWYAQVGAQLLYQKMASLGLAWRGAENFMAGGLQVQGWAMPMKDKPLEVYAIVGLGLDSDLYAETFDSLELTAKYTIGKTQWYLGVLYAPEFSRLIAKEWADFDQATRDTSVIAPLSSGLAHLEMTAIYMRGRIAF